MTIKKAQIKNGGLFRKGRVIVTNIKANGEEGESKSYIVMGKVKVSSMDGKYILDFTSVSGGSGGFTNRGTVSGRVYTRRQSIVVNEYTMIND